MSFDPEQLRFIFLAALELSEPRARGEYLDRACGSDLPLRVRIEELLAAAEQPDSLLDGMAKKPATFDQVAGTPITENNSQVPLNAGESFGQLATGNIISQRYTLEKKIGEGGMGEVWVARQTEPVKRRVALKLIKAGMDSKGVIARFEQERQALALMDHPNIARVLDGGITNTGQPFFVMELVNGLPLTKFCDEAKLTTQDRLEIFVPICQAVQHAHQKGIVHRDLKPANILVTLIDGKAVPKVIDFGVAKATQGKLIDDSLLTNFGGVVGTLEYMAPEQAGFSGVDIDTRADVYSLGVILYELLTGLRPLDARRLKQAAFAEMVRIIQEEEPSKPSTKLSSDESLASLAALRQIEPRKLMALLRGELDWVVMKCLEKQRDRRYESVSGLAQDIQRYLADEPVEARPPSARYRVGKFLKRHKATTISAAIVLIALVAGIVGTSIGLMQARKAEAFAKSEFDKAEIARSQAAALAISEANERKKAEALEAQTLADYRAGTEDAIEQLIASKPVIGPRERKYLENTLKRWQAFASRKGETEHSRAMSGEGHFRVANIWMNLTRSKEAKAEFEIARDIYRELVKQYPNVKEYQRRLASIHNNLGLLLQNSLRNQDALHEHQAAREIFQNLAKQEPQSLNYQHDLSNNSNNLSVVLAALGRREEALNEAYNCREISRKLVEKDSKYAFYQQSLAHAYDNLGSQLANSGRPNEAIVEYQSALKLGKTLVARDPDFHRFQMDFASTQNNLANMLNEIGKRQEARAMFQEACETCKKLVEQNPAVPHYQLQWATYHFNLANQWLALGNRKEATSSYQTSIAIASKLIEKNPNQPSYQIALARAHCNFADLFERYGDQQGAIQHYQSARDYYKLLIVHFPESLEYQRSLGFVRNNLGLNYQGVGKSEEARAEYIAARDIFKSLIQRVPADPTYPTALGGCYCNYGAVLRNDGKPAESLEWLDLAVSTLAPVVQRQPNNLWAKSNLWSSYISRAQSYDELKRPAESLKDWALAMPISPPDQVLVTRAGIAYAKAHAGQYAQAITEAIELTKSGKWSAEQWYYFASIYALGSEKIAGKQKEYSDRALELLDKAVKIGYSNYPQISKDADLNSLRNRDDFKALMAKVPKQQP